MRWLLVGAGDMASALVGGLLGAGTDARRTRLVDTDAAARACAATAFGCAVHADVATALDALGAGIDARVGDGDTAMAMARRPPAPATRHARGSSSR